MDETVTPRLLLRWWEDAHSPLSEIHVQKFLDCEELKELYRFESQIVQDAIRKNKKLTNALDAARTETRLQVLMLTRTLALVRQVTETHEGIARKLAEIKEVAESRRRAKQLDSSQTANSMREDHYLRSGRCEWCDAVLFVHEVHECFR